jgi:hypothetical protein
MNMPDELLAWAAGLYDGEGSASAYVPRHRKTARRQMQVSQGGLPGSPPAVLVRFREIVGEGNVTGPYGGDLYYWKTTRKDAVDDIARALWPYLSAEKRMQFLAMTERSGRSFLVDAGAVRKAATEHPWAAGLFDGEGSVWETKKPAYPRWRGLAMELPQSSLAGIPETLTRFHAVVGVGVISGPRVQRNPWSKKPQYRWRTSGRRAVGHVIRSLWPWLGAVNRARLLAVRHLLDPEVRDLLEREL